MAEHKKEFFSLLKNHFYGTKLNGKAGKTKMLIYKLQYFETIKKQIETKIEQNKAENFYNVLYTFFSKYLNETGTPFLCSTKHQKELIQINNSREDVKLFYKTEGLYYIKSERVFTQDGQTIEFEFEGKTHKIHFNESELKIKSTNVKDELVFIKNSEQEIGVRYKSDTGLFTFKIIKEKEGLFADAIKHYKKQGEVDFFIHSNAKAFLTDAFKVFLLNSVYSESEFSKSFVDHLRQIKEVGEQIIGYLASFEDELKNMWLKPKFAKTVNYCISLSSLEVSIKQEVLKNLPKSQVEEWQKLGMIAENFDVGQMHDLTGEKQEYKHLPIDTKHFEEEIKYKILSSFNDLEGQTDGVLIKSDNFQALNTLQNKYRGKVQTIYIDPPYNTNLSEIEYKNNFKHSSWMCLMENRLSFTNHFLKEEGTIAVAIDDLEFPRLKLLMEEVLDVENLIGNIAIIHNPAGRDEFYIAPAHEYLIVFAKNYAKAQFNKFATENKEGEKRELGLRRSGSDSLKENRPNLFYPIYFNLKSGELSLNYFEGAKEILPIDEQGNERTWRWGKKKVEQAILKKEIYIKEYRGGYIVKTIEDALLEKTCKSIWHEPKYSAGVHGTNLLKDMIGSNDFDYPKSIYAVMDYLRLTTESENEDLVLDYFAGSGTTAHAVINLNREDDGNRKYILVDIGGHFESVILPRIKKAIFSSQWKNEKPMTFDGIKHIFKYYTLESYEETLENSHYALDEKKEYEHITKLKETKETGLKGMLDLQMSEYLLSKGLDISGKTPLLTLQELYKGEIDIIETIANIKGYTIDVIYSKTRVKFKEEKEITDLSKMDLNDFAFLLPYLFLA